MTPDTQTFLLGRARAAIAAHLRSGALDAPARVPEEALGFRGCFVTLFQNGKELRGCIGTFEADCPLWRTVEEMAVAAASRDPRFPPLASDELDSCTIDISALSAPTPTHPDAVEVGAHGLVVEGRGKRGVLLPQVARDRGWDRETFLNNTCRKAGLSPDAWRESGVLVLTFTAEVFAEHA